MLKIYNTLSKQKQEFVPITAGRVKLYVCGMTVYDYCHLGHARVLVAFDVITRYLQASGFQVTYVRNITDIDDKIIVRAQQQQEDYMSLTSRFIAAMHEDAYALNVLPPSHEPKATEFIGQMIQLIETLLVKGYAYIADNGDVYYKVNQFTEYGCLAHQDLEKLIAGSRVAVAEAKHSPLDFVLWKLAKPNEPHWPSPWGEGRPGWHIECSAMSMHFLGEHFDLHGGGFDLTFPHHENEIAQSKAATGKEFVNTWLHVGYLQVEKEKMSKSVGNFLTIRDVLSHYSVEVVRYFLLASHYRSPLNYSSEALNSAQGALTRLYTALRGCEVALPLLNDEFLQRFNAAMDDDFNTPDALAVLFDLARETNRMKEIDFAKAQQLAANLRHMSGVLGLCQQSPKEFLQAGIKEELQTHIEALIAQREQVRLAKDWQAADLLRQELLSMGVVLEDTSQGTIWRHI